MGIGEVDKIVPKRATFTKFYQGPVEADDVMRIADWNNDDPARCSRAVVSGATLLGILESGAVDAYGLTEEELAVICSSHSGESFHVNAIRSILSKAGLGEEYLQCGVHAPLNEQAAKALEQSGQAPGQIHNNCSGKHTGMLITAKHLGESLEDYYQPYHKVQRRIIEMIAYICQYDREKIVIGVDGCGVPVHALPLYHAAWGAARMACPETLGDRGSHAARIVSAMMAHPEMVSGTGRFDAILMEEFQGNLFSKAGADGYEIVGIKDMFFCVVSSSSRVRSTTA